MHPGKLWFRENGWQPFDFQLSAWEAYANGKSGLVTAPTGYGKTYSLCIPALIAHAEGPPGVKVIWITPIRALAKEIYQAWERAAEGLDIDFKIALRTGDTDSTARKRMQTEPPDVLVTTPESLHVMLATVGYRKFLGNLEAIICDEWHELVGSKRGVLIELALSRIWAFRPDLRVWGISATIGNIDEAIDVLFGTRRKWLQPVRIEGKQNKRIDVIPLAPENIEDFPWAGYFGLKMFNEVLGVIREARSTIVFTNTRSMCERWYQVLLDEEPKLAGQIAMHHGSISRELRDWVEEALYNGKLKAVVSTSSLDLGVDFRPVECVIQIGSPKGVARCMQRAGRSGHSPGALSRIYFVPTHALELIEAAALRSAIGDGLLEARTPYVRSFDVLVQYLVTLAVSDGFQEEEVYREIKSTFSYESLTREEWHWALDFIVYGGSSLEAYNEFKKVERVSGRLKVTDKRIALKHRLSIGTIVSDISLTVKYMSGRSLGTIEETFISMLKKGDVFWFAGRSLEFIQVKENSAFVRKTKKKSGRIPSWQGGRMALSSQLSRILRNKVVEYTTGKGTDAELQILGPLLAIQQRYSAVPGKGEFLIEQYRSKEGHHVVMYPFEGRAVHEGMAALIAYRLTQLRPITFSIAMNDYGFELLSDQPIPLQEGMEQMLFGTANLERDIQNSVNGIEMAKRKFHEICRIAGLVFQGYPGRHKKSRHLHATTGLMFEVFKQYDDSNLLYLQAYDEALYFQLEKVRLQEALERIQKMKPLITEPVKFTPFALPIVADSLMRERITSEKMESRLERMKIELLEG